MECEEALNDDWEKFLDGEEEDIKEKKIDEEEIPKCGDIYISTKTKIAYLDTAIDINNVFWKIKIQPYNNASNGVIKKQMKLTFTSKEESVSMQEKLKNENYYVDDLITKVEKVKGRTKFKEVRKVTIGVSKKDILTHRSKKKGAFYNCFVIILRLCTDEVKKIFKEVHVKIFNTGKLEIPGLQDNKNMDKIMDTIINILEPIVENKITYNKEKIETVLINSNFCCNYFINREKFYNILKFDYNINAIYDPCSYPGIQCKHYLNSDKTRHISYMIFRTGSILIVGKCNDRELYEVYNFIKKILADEYSNIRVCDVNEEENYLNKKSSQEKKKKIKKVINIQKKQIDINN